MTAPVLLWLRRDFRLSDHAALTAALASGRPVIPIFLHDETLDDLGAAPRWRLGLAIERFSDTLQKLGSRLILRKGAALAELQSLVAETGARSVFWSRAYDPAAIRRDKAVKAALTAQGIQAQSFPGHVLFEPWQVETGSGGMYRVYSPFWKAVRGRDVGAPLPAPGALPAPDQWPSSVPLSDWRMGAGMQRGAAVVRPHLLLGEEAARGQLVRFSEDHLPRYGKDRDYPSLPATSGLSEPLAYGEISPREIWHTGKTAWEAGTPGAETFLKELVWREFAYHLMYHTPHILQRCWREAWEDFPWQTDPGQPQVQAWQQGRTGVPMVDAGMRELYVTGRMHNRARMLVGSYLTKHLMTDWRIGQRWFADTLVDWDPASNAMGWQWVAGCGPDAAPYFRIFNPETQRSKFDPSETYIRRWVAELSDRPDATALSYFAAAPSVWGLSANTPYPEPVVDLKTGRELALSAYQSRTF